MVLIAKGGGSVNPYRSTDLDDNFQKQESKLQQGLYPQPTTNPMFDILSATVPATPPSRPRTAGTISLFANAIGISGAKVGSHRCGS
jgi:hypothetical protein